MGWKKALKSIAGAINPAVVFGTGAQLAGDIYAADKQARENSEQRRHTDQVNIANYEMQKEFAQNSIRWKTEDAIAAGLHPLAALGAQGYSASPSAVAGEADHSRSELYSKMGQNIGRAISATQTQQERQFGMLRLENAALENEMLRTRIAAEKRLLSGTGPAFPGYTNDTFLTGQGDRSMAAGTDPRVVDVPLRRTVSDPLYSGKEAGAIPDFNLAKTSRGYAVVPAADVKQRIEDDFIAEQQWKIRTYTAVLNGDIRLPGGQRATVNPLTGELFPVRNKFVTDVYDKFRKGPFRIFERFRGE